MENQNEISEQEQWKLRSIISSKGRYALRLMVELCSYDGEEYVPLQEIAERQQISKKYLEMIAKELVNAGLLVSHGGRGGGYRLCRKPQEYPIGEIIECLEGPICTTACAFPDSTPCERAAFCKALPIWEELDCLVHDYLYRKTLADL